MSALAEIDQEAIRELAKELGRPIGTLVVLENDPFYATDAKQLKGQWFAGIYQEYGFRPSSYLRRIHYALASSTSVLDWDGLPYQNTERCWDDLLLASLYARHLRLIPLGELADHRNPDPVLRLQQPPADPTAEPSGPCLDGFDAVSLEGADEGDPPRLWLGELGDLGRLSLSPRAARPELVLPALGNVETEEPIQPYHLEIWCEKTACADILDPIAIAYDLNIVYGAGDLSETACQAAMRRVAANGGRPVRVLYISDFDPRGHGMPVAVARKIEFLIRTYHPEIDLQLRPIVLTEAQCQQFNLPRIPISETDRGRAKFEERFGAGRVELDAMEALRPGELHRIVVEEILRYHVDEEDLRDQWADICANTDAELEAATEEVHVAHGDEIDDLRDDLDAVTETAEQFRDQIAEAIAPVNAELAGLASVRRALRERAEQALAPILAEYQTTVTEPVVALRERAVEAVAPILEQYQIDVIEAAEGLRERADEVFADIAEDLRVHAAGVLADMDSIAADGDEDPDPLYDSSRDYIQQIDVYKAHQGKPVAKVCTVKECTCIQCGRSFTSVRPARWCSDQCRNKPRR